MNPSEVNVGMPIVIFCTHTHDLLAIFLFPEEAMNWDATKTRRTRGAILVFFITASAVKVSTFLIFLCLVYTLYLSWLHLIYKQLALKRTDWVSIIAVQFLMLCLRSFRPPPQFPLISVYHLFFSFIAKKQVNHDSKILISNVHSYLALSLQAGEMLLSRKLKFLCSIVVFPRL